MIRLNRAQAEGRRTQPALIIPCIMFLCGQAWAVDGLREINQSCAVVGCFPGDDPGFPVTITQEGSYVLTSNLDITGEKSPEDVTVIDINHRHVNIDLNGFSIIGPTVCMNIPVDSCAPIGSGFGIEGLERTTIRNGTIRGTGNSCVRVNSGSRVEDMSMYHCGGPGISLNGGHGLVLNNQIRQVGHHGVAASSNSMLIGNQIFGCDMLGLSGNSSTGYVNNLIANNGDGDVNVSGPVDLGGNICSGGACP